MDFLLLALSFLQLDARPPAVVPDAPPFFERVLEDARREYPEIRFELRPESTLVVASAEVVGGRKLVRLDGGLIRSPRLDADVLRFVICHELGHLYGGAPRRALPPEWTGDQAPDGRSLLSAEGQSDYYAAAACFHRLADRARADGTPESRDGLAPDEEAAVERGCAGLADESLCRRTLRAGRGMLVLVRDFPISFLTPSTERVARTNADSYPSRQCRLDTIRAGALCRGRVLDPGDLYNPRPGLCDNPAGERPPCWFHADGGL